MYSTPFDLEGNETILALLAVFIATLVLLPQFLALLRAANKDKDE